MTGQRRAIIIGSGPNGLAAGIVLARAGWQVEMVEAKATVGGGMRSAELTLPGFVHDICSAIHPLGLGSPFFKTLPLTDYGVEWIQPPLAAAHPFDDGTAAALARDIDTTADRLGPDATHYRRLMRPLTDQWDTLSEFFLGPFRIPRHPFRLVRFGLGALQSASFLARRTFTTERARGLFAGLAAHSVLPLEQSPSAAFGLVLGVAGHAIGWPLPRGGSQKIADALAAYLRDLGGTITLNTPVRSLADLPRADAYLFNTAPDQLLHIAGDKFNAWYRWHLKRFRYGPGVFKVDFATSEPIPWRAPDCRQAGTVHLGATLDEIAASERAMWTGRHSERPYVLVTQQSLFDDTRAPTGQHTVWAYCHVPAGSTVDMTDAIEAQIDRFAPGFRDTILAKHTMNNRDFAAHNPNYVGGAVTGGVQDFFQLYTRPSLNIFNPYATPARDIFIASASTPPGGGVHGMAGYHAAQAIMRRFPQP